MNYVSRVIGEKDSVAADENDDLKASYSYTTSTDGGPVGMVKEMTDPEGVKTKYVFETTTTPTKRPRFLGNSNTGRSNV